MWEYQSAGCSMRNRVKCIGRQRWAKPSARYGCHDHRSRGGANHWQWLCAIDEFAEDSDFSSPDETIPLQRPEVLSAPWNIANPSVLSHK